jgi:hypothetical protein
MASAVARADVYKPPELPWANCSGDIAAHETVLEARALPGEDAKVVAGTPVTFSAPSPTPVTFAVASSPTLLASPNIDQGLGQPLPSENEEHMQVFTSSKAALAPGTVYWQVSFSAAEVEGCAGVLSGIITIPPRTLVVESPAPVPVPVPVIGPWQVSIASASGGVQQFTHRYTGASLRTLRRLIRAGDELDVQISSTVTDAGASTAVAHTTARLD